MPVFETEMSWKSPQIDYKNIYYCEASIFERRGIYSFIIYKRMFYEAFPCLILALMNNEKTERTLELQDFDEMVEHLKLGWTPTGRYIVNIGENGQPAQTPRHILSWRKGSPPARPESRIEARIYETI
jgi:hypothetical protein